MAVPTYEEFMLPALQLMSDGKTRRNSEIIEEVAMLMKLSEEDKMIMVPSQTEYTYENRIGWALYYIMRAGLLERPKRGYYKITNRGILVLGKKPFNINKSFLMQFDEFQAFQNIAKTPKDVLEIKETSSITPQESIQIAYRDINKSLISDLLDIIKKVKPSFFEKLVVNLLLSMGYGGSGTDAGKVVGKSGDGGIDGIIDQDKLGLDKIYIQAKRWQNNVGSPELNSFVGSLVGFHADKGVFITTSDFNKSALEYVSKAGKNIILINGQKLVELMIEHNVGVSEHERYIVKKIDHDYFSDEDI